MKRSLVIWLVAVSLAATPHGCGWHVTGDVSLRQLPYPYEAGIALNMGATPAPLVHRGVVFADDGEDVHTVGQNAPCSLVDRGRQLFESLTFLYARREWRGASFFGNRLAEATASESGRLAFTYKTYVRSPTGIPTSVPPDVVVQMTSAVTYELRAKGGVMVIGSPSAGDGLRPPVELPAAALKHLRAEDAAGNVKLFELGELLAYDHIRRHLVWEATTGDDGVSIRILSVDDGVATPWVPSPEELKGITFYTPDAEHTTVSLGGASLNVVANPPDRTRRESVTVSGEPASGSESEFSTPSDGPTSRPVAWE